MEVEGDSREEAGDAQMEQDKHIARYMAVVKEKDELEKVSRVSPGSIPR
jgi:hypothetical protein